MINTSIGGRLKDLLFYATDSIAMYRRMYEIAEKLGILEWGDEQYFDVFFQTYGSDKGITFSPAGFNDKGSKIEWMIKELMPKVHHFDKGFNEKTNEITFTATYDGVKIVIKSTPPSTCTVETYEEDEFIAAVEARPATIRKVTKYRLVGDCLPVIAEK